MDILISVHDSKIPSLEGTTPTTQTQSNRIAIVPGASWASKMAYLHWTSLVKFYRRWTLFGNKEHENLVYLQGRHMCMT